MKLDIHLLRLNVVTPETEIHQKLLRHLYFEVYGKVCFKSWKKISPTVSQLDLFADLDLHQMARDLREKGWRIYHWCDRYGVNDMSDTNTYINYGPGNGLIIGRYCPNLTAWLLANT